MAPITNILRRDEGDDQFQDGSFSYNLTIAFVALFFVGCALVAGMVIFRRLRHKRQIKEMAASYERTHRRTHNTTSISISHEKSAFLVDEPSSPTESVPEIRITFPEDNNPEGKRQSRVVIVKISDKGSVGYEPYQEPLPVYKEKESSQFENLDLERIGGLKEKDSKA